ncbi:hypothetical protein VTJ49DRAFT_4864 [Mycothermus thermophilus]|uniref:J domain-containing protein n=1 Tax=Humicola insolens TaxID=85995 RepID=A0ABR3V4G2_HUMIN
MPDLDLLTYARDAGSRGDDLYALLGADATANEADIRRAFRRRALTAHPDKAGDAYDPALYERIERARDVLLDSEARAAYTEAMRAVLLKKEERERMSAKRRRLVEELERREREAEEERGKRMKMNMGQEVVDAERAALAARGRAKMEEMRRMREEAERREREGSREKAATMRATSVGGEGEDGVNEPTTTTTTTTTTREGEKDGGDDYDERIAELERRLREKQQRKAEKEQRKAEKKAKKEAGDGQGRQQHPPPSQPPSSHPTAVESQADENKASSVPSFSSNKPADAANCASQPGNRFASTMARLRAAQAKKEEEKRRKAEEAARAAAGVSAS